MTPTDLITPALMQAVRDQYRLDWTGIHGAAHWGRVLDNALSLAPETGAREDVVTLFAVLHDACRHNDRRDPDHGPRASAFARDLHAQGVFALDADGLDLLTAATWGHTSDRTHADATVRTCYDADRLDLLRCGISPDPHYLCTAEARRPERIAWANARALAGHVPTIVADW